MTDTILYNDRKEREEAIVAGERALDSLKNAQKDLNDARLWGIFDMFGGGFFSTMIKRSKMSNATSNLERAKYDLKQFSKEVHDVQMMCDVSFDSSGLLHFADYFFDGLLADWLVQDRINQARRQVSEAIDQVEYMLGQLRTGMV